RIPLHQFQKALNDCFLERVAGGAAVGIGMHAARAFIEKVHQAGWKIFEAAVAQRPSRRPVYFSRRIERSRRRHALLICRRLETALVLRAAVEQHLVRMDRLASREIVETPPHPDLVALIDAGIALDRLHQRARLALLGGAALAEAAAGEAGAQFMNVR